MFKELAEKYYPEMLAIREDLHRHPELSYKEFRTAELIEAKLKEYGVDAMERMFDTGVVALIHGKKGPGKCIGIRADIDALPVEEETGVPLPPRTRASCTPAATISTSRTCCAWRRCSVNAATSSPARSS